MDTGSIGSANLLSFFQAMSSSAPATQAPAHGHHFHGSAAQPTQAADDSTATLHYRRTERAGLSIVTQEGDVVSLRIKVKDSLDATASNAPDDSTQVAQLSVGSRSSMKISFHVDGDLNANELAAIQDVVQQVGALADQFFAGDVPAAFAAAQDLNIDGSQLAKVGLRLSVRESVTYSGPAPTAAAPSTPAPAPTLPSTAPVSTAPVSAETGDATPVATEPAATEPAATASDTSSTTDAPAVGDTAPTPPATDAAPAPSTPGPTSAAGSALAVIGDFLHQLLGTLGTQSDGGSQASLSVSLKLRIFAATVAHISIAASPATEPAASTDSNAHPLLGDTLDALAAAHDPPLSATA